MFLFLSCLSGCRGTFYPFLVLSHQPTKHSTDTSSSAPCIIFPNFAPRSLSNASGYTTIYPNSQKSILGVSSRVLGAFMLSHHPPPQSQNFYFFSEVGVPMRRASPVCRKMLYPLSPLFAVVKICRTICVMSNYALSVPLYPPALPCWGQNFQVQGAGLASLISALVFFPLSIPFMQSLMQCNPLCPYHTLSIISILPPL